MTRDSLSRRDFLKCTSAGAAAWLAGCRALPDSRRPAPSPLPRRVLGRSGLEVSILGFGSHTTSELLAKPGERESHLRYALEQGVNFFDIYPNPRGGPSTYRVGMAAPAMEAFARAIPPRSAALLSMMMPPAMADLEAALKLLGRDHIDAVRIFWGDPPRPEREALYETMVKARQQGKVRALGMSVHAEARFVREFRRHPYDFAMAIYNFHENCDEYAELTPLLRAQGAAIIAMKCMGRGALLDFARQVRGRRDFADIPHVSVSAAALRFTWQRRDVALALPTMLSLDEVRGNIAAARRPALSNDEAALLERLSMAAGDRCRSMKFEA